MKQFFKNNLTSLLFCGAFVLFTAAVLIALLAVSAHYPELYNTPRLRDAQLDLQGYDMADRKVEYNLGGEWEFYYNKWIVSEDKDATPNGKIRIPGRWNEAFDLPAGGYASYKIVLKNTRPGMGFTLVHNNFRGAYRAYINGKFVASNGVVSKRPQDVFCAGRMDDVQSYVSEGGDLTLVIELAYSAGGGLTAAPWLTASSSAEITERLSNRVQSIILFMMGCMFFLCLNGVIYNAVLHKGDSVGFTPLLWCAFGNQVFSKDGSLFFTMQFWGIDYRILAALGFLFAVGTVIAYLYLAAKEGFLPVKLPFAAAGVSVLAAVTVALHFTSWQCLPMILMWGMLAALAYCIGKSNRHGRAQKFAYLAMLILVATVFLIEFADGTGFIVYGTEAIISAVLLLLVLVASVINYVNIREVAKRSLRTMELERELNDVREKALRAQIKPHFIFNTLTCIQDLYHADTQKGDTALKSFSDHLRLNVDSQKEALIDFEQELDNIQNYFSLENMRCGDKIHLYYDIECVDFKLPVLSLQPFVENSIKHGRLDARPDGYVQIGSKRADNTVTVSVTDNGVGFCPDKVRVGAQGIENCRKRLAVMLGARVEITSREGLGTQVKIRFKG